MNSRISILFLIGLLPFIVACGDNNKTQAQQISLNDNQLVFTSIQNVEDLLAANITPPMTANIDPRSATLSPNGEIIVFYHRDRERRIGMVCEYTFSSNATICVDGGEELPDFIGGFWSPNSRYVVLDSDVTALQFMNESDLTIYDTQTDTIINRTDDGVSVREDIFEDDVRNRVWADTAPIFAPNGDLYFFRNAIDTSVDEWRADLVRIPASEITGTSAPEVLWRHPTIGAYPVFRTSDWFLNGAMSISPDGKYLAIASISLGRPDDTSNGIWLFDLTEKTAKTHIPISRLGEVTVGMPTWLAETMVSVQFAGIIPNSLAWASDSSLVIKASNQLYYTKFFVPTYKYNVATDTLTSIYDFTTLSEEDYRPNTALFDDISLFADVNPTTAVVSPSGQTMFYIGLNQIADTFVLSAMSLVESGFAIPRRIATVDDYVPMTRVVTSIGYTAPTLRILTGTQLITLTEQ